MKIEQKTEQKFEPITLTIETEQEFQLLISFFGGVSNYEVEKLTRQKVQEDFIYKTYLVLLEIKRKHLINEVIGFNNITCKN